MKPQPTNTNPIGRALCRLGTVIRQAGKFVWKWSVVHRSGHRPDDIIYSDVWGIEITPEAVCSALLEAFPDIAKEQIPIEEEDIRRLLRVRFPPSLASVSTAKDSEALGNGGELVVEQEPHKRKLLEEAPEEIWSHIPCHLRYMLAAMNASNMEKKLAHLSNEPYHTPIGAGCISRSSLGVRKTFNMWRHGFANGVSRRERVSVNIFFVVLAFSAVYPDVAAGFLGERSYNQRSIGSRIVTLIQLFFLRTYPYPSFWLLFNWSLERLLGAFVGNSVYALVAIVPAIRTAYHKTWFRTMLLALSMCWQVGVQFSLTIRDYVARLLTRRQMRAMRVSCKLDGLDWASIDKDIAWELVSLKTYMMQQNQPDSVPKAWCDVPTKVRTERFIQFTQCFQLGRPADQLVGLLKDDLESVINTYEDYHSTASGSMAAVDKANDHKEPRIPKFTLVLFDIGIFAYVCYSFYPQPFTFNTVVAYGTVVVLKQAVVAFKRYQTTKSARRLFTNMVSINILGMLLVSTPVTVDREVLTSNVNFILLTLAMAVSTLFLAEPIAPLLLSLTERIARGLVAIKSRWNSRKALEVDQSEVHSVQ